MNDLVVAYWTSDVEGTAPLDFLLRHALWTPSAYLMSCRIMSIISVVCDFTTKSGGIWTKHHVTIPPFCTWSTPQCTGVGFMKRTSSPQDHLRRFREADARYRYWLIRESLCL